MLRHFLLRIGPVFHGHGYGSEVRPHAVVQAEVSLGEGPADETDLVIRFDDPRKQMVRQPEGIFRIVVGICRTVQRVTEGPEVVAQGL